MRALVTGATGFIGRPLCAAAGDAVALARDPARASALPGVASAHGWDAEREVPAAALDGIDAVFHLAGEPIAEGRLDAEHRRRVLESRVNGTRRVVEAISRARPRPPVLVAASAVGFYGSRGDEELDESSAPGAGFLAELCARWEEEARAAAALGVRVVALRIGVVLGPGGGALARMLPFFRLGLGGRVGDGRQWMPWIHRDDVVGLALHAARDPSLAGPVNATAPAPVTNRELTRALGEVLHRPAILPVPVAALRVAFGDLAGVLVASQRALPRAALRAGYRFRFDDLRAALADAISRKERA
jgi:uncharacterized protein (TIGR01777 family)